MEIEKRLTMPAGREDGAAPPDEPPPFLDLSPFRSMSLVVAALRRRCRFWTATAICGAVLGFALSIAFPPRHSATTRLFVRPAGQGDPASLMENELALLQTRVVAREAIERAGLRMSPQELISNYTARPRSNNVFELTVEAPSASEAIRRTGAVAEAFLDFRRQELRRQSEAVVSSLEKRRDELTAELSKATEDMQGLSGESEGDVRALGELLTRRSTLNGQIDELNQRIDAAVAGPASAAAESTVIDPASEDRRSPIRALAVNMVSGLIGGIGLGAGVVIVRELVTDRIRRRADVRDALGAPVAVSVGSLRGRLRREMRRFRRGIFTPSADVSRVVRHLRGSLSRSNSLPEALVVVSVDSDGAAALSVAATAAELAKEGKQVLVADQSRGLALRRLLKAATGETPSAESGGIPSRLRLAVASDQQSGMEDADRAISAASEIMETSDAVIVLASIDLGLGARHLVSWARRAVIVVTAGRSTGRGLASVSELLRVAGVEVDSVILVGSDPNDDTVGLVEPPMGGRSWERSAVEARW